MTIYIDIDFKCHVTDGGGMTPIETDAFDGKCNRYIEGFRFVPAGETWTRKDGVAFQGEMISPHTDYAILAAYQEQYESTTPIMADMKQALDILGITDEPID